jgi:DNA-binding MarR family transcriptional regulator
MTPPPFAQQRPPRATHSSDNDTIRDLAWFRYNLRKFLRFSEKAARQCGVTPQQHQLMLGVAGFTGRDWATISELAEFMQERHNSVVGLVERAARCGLVRKEQDTADRRFVFVSLTPRGAGILAQLTEMHRGEVQTAREIFFQRPDVPSQVPGAEN